MIGDAELYSEYNHVFRADRGRCGLGVGCRFDRCRKEKGRGSEMNFLDSEDV